MFEFGEQKPFVNRWGEEVLRAERMVRFFSDWRVVEGTEVVFGSPDHATKRRFYHRQTPPKEPLRRRAWSRAKRFFERVDEGVLRVVEIRIDPTLNLRIGLTEGYAIEGFRLSPFDDWLWWYDDDASGSQVCAETLGENEVGDGRYRG